MRPTTANLILFALVAMGFAVVGGCILRFAGRSVGPLSAGLRSFARVLIVVGFFLAGTLLWDHLSGQMGSDPVWFRAPSFYLVTAFLCASGFWWLGRARVRESKAMTGLASYPILIVLLVAGWQFALHSLKENRREAIGEALHSVRDQIAPEIQFVDANGAPHRLSEFKGKVVLVNFWATTCPPCVAEMPDLSKLQDKLKERGFVLLYLSSEEPDVLARFFRGRHLIGVNGRLVPEVPAPAFYSPGMAYPMSFLLSRDGVVKDSWVGALPPEWTEKKIEGQL